MLGISGGLGSEPAIQFSQHPFLFKMELDMTRKYAKALSCVDYTEDQQAIIREAITILESKIRTTDSLTRSADTKRFCQLQLASESDEIFGCLFLDSQHRLISFEKLFRGTIDGASVHPRAVVRRCLELNAAASIFTHNHPSGSTEPSQADISLTRRLKNALALIDVRVLDHIVVGTEGCTSLAERGFL
jgi:DNA repair protein RadC